MTFGGTAAIAARVCSFTATGFRSFILTGHGRFPFGMVTYVRQVMTSFEKSDQNIFQTI